MLDTNVPMAIGARCGEDKFTGYIDEVRVHADRVFIYYISTSNSVYP